MTDVGTNSTERFSYPISGYKVAKLVASGTMDGGVLICETGVSISLAANISERESGSASAVSYIRQSFPSSITIPTSLRSVPKSSVSKPRR